MVPGVLRYHQDRPASSSASCPRATSRSCRSKRPRTRAARPARPASPRDNSNKRRRRSSPPASVRGIRGGCRSACGALGGGGRARRLRAVRGAYHTQCSDPRERKPVSGGRGHREPEAQAQVSVAVLVPGSAARRLPGPGPSPSPAPAVSAASAERRRRISPAIISRCAASAAARSGSLADQRSTMRSVTSRPSFFRASWMSRTTSRARPSAQRRRHGQVKRDGLAAGSSDAPAFERRLRHDHIPGGQRDIAKRRHRNGRRPRGQRRGQRRRIGRADRRGHRLHRQTRTACQATGTAA